MKIIKILIDDILDILFASKCLGCKARNQILCERCIDKIDYTDRVTENGIKAVYDYRDKLIQKAIWELKYHRHQHLGKILGNLLYTNLIEYISEIQSFSAGSTIIVIPVPVSETKRKLRGYNQSEIIAKSFCENNPSIFELNNNIICKKTNSIPQAKINNRKKRLKNIINAFSIQNKQEIKNKTIIIIDDVTTTGGTMLEIIKLLNKNGAKRVFGFAVAH